MAELSIRAPWMFLSRELQRRGEMSEAPSDNFHVSAEFLEDRGLLRRNAVLSLPGAIGELHSSGFDSHCVAVQVVIGVHSRS